MTQAAATAPATGSAHRIPLWVDLRHVPVNKRLGLLHAAEEVAAEHVLLAKGDPHVDRADLKAVTVDGHNVLRHAGKPLGRIVKVKDAKSQAKAAAADGIVLADADDWRVIPLENLVAARADRPGTLFALTRDAEESTLLARILETGVHGIVLAPPSPAAVFAADRLLRAAWTQRPALLQPLQPLQTAPPSATLAPAPAPAPVAVQASESPTDRATAEQPAPSAAPASAAPIPLVPARITRLADGGFGDRVCVDCTSLFEDGEGLLVGSTARSFILVHAETPSSQLIEARPFRVNAGAVHSYVLAPGGRTRYLSELRAGEAALAVGRLGSGRTLTIGRCKVERRPHTMVFWQTARGEASAVLQTAETIRLVRPDGTLVAVTALKPGDEVLVHHEDAARHTGLPIAESMEER